MKLFQVKPPHSRRSLVCGCDRLAVGEIRFVERHEDSLTPLKYYVRNYVYWQTDEIGIKEVDRIHAMDPTTARCVKRLLRAHATRDTADGFSSLVFRSCVLNELRMMRDMQTWEYLFFVFNAVEEKVVDPDSAYNGEYLRRLLPKLGSDRWELVNVAPHSETWHTMYFKRPQSE